MFYRVLTVLYSITIVFTVATELRIGGVFGISELAGLLFLLFSVGYIIRNGIHIDYPFILFTLASLIVLVTSTTFYSLKGNPIEIRDLFAYVYAWVLTLVFISLVSGNRAILIYFIKSLLTIGVMYCLIINIGSLYYPSFVYQGVRLSGWSTNPNQFALLLVLLTGVAIYFRQLIDFNRKKHYLFVGIFLVTSLRTFSDALIVSLAVSTIVFVILSNFIRIGFVKFLALSCLVLSVALFSLISLYDQIPSYISILFDGMNENSQGDDRINLWKNGLYSIEDSLLIGNGAGAHSGVYGPFEQTEAHNTYIDWLTQTGLLGLNFLFLFIYYCFSKSRLYSVSHSCFYYTLMCVFVVFHFVLRQPIFWLYMILPVIYNNVLVFNRLNK